MTIPPQNALRLAWARLSWRVLLLEWLGSLLLLLMAFAWLQIPDSHAWQFSFSMVSIVLLVTGFVWLQTLVFRGLLRRASGPAPFWLRLLLCVALAAVWLFLLNRIAVAIDNAPLYAGYWNSKFSASQRPFWTYQRLLNLQRWFWDFVQWGLAAFLAPLALEVGTAGISREGWRSIRGVYPHWFYWLVAIGSGCIGAALVNALVNWVPGTGVAQEVLSVLLRLGVAYTIIVFLVCFVLALAAEYLMRARQSFAVAEAEN